MAEILAYTDGSYNKDANLIGGATIIRGDQRPVLNHYLSMTIDGKDFPQLASSYQIAGECFGALNAVRYAIDNGLSSIDIYFDYQGVGSWADHEWKTSSAIAKYYVTKMDEMRQSIEVNFIKVKAHADNKLNNLADAMAKYACRVEPELPVGVHKSQIAEFDLRH